MLTLRQAQLDALTNGSVEIFVGECLAHVELKYPEKVKAMGREEARILVRKAVAKARALPLEYEREIRAMVELAFEHGLDFDTREELAYTFGVLHDTSLPPETRMSLLEARLETERSENSLSAGV